MSHYAHRRAARAALLLALLFTSCRASGGGASGASSVGELRCDRLVVDLGGGAELVVGELDGAKGLFLRSVDGLSGGFELVVGDGRSPHGDAKLVLRDRTGAELLLLTAVRTGDGVALASLAMQGSRGANVHLYSCDGGPVMLELRSNAFEPMGEAPESIPREQLEASAHFGLFGAHGYAGMVPREVGFDDETRDDG